MRNKITLVTPPDDIIVDGFRILTYDLEPHQSQLISEALVKLDNIPSTVIYIANGKDDPSWIIDKKQKCSIIVLNAESLDQTMVGYLIAQRNSYYFGNLRSITGVNNSAIQNIEELKNTLEEHIIRYEKL